MWASGRSRSSSVAAWSTASRTFASGSTNRRASGSPSRERQAVSGGRPTPLERRYHAAINGGDFDESQRALAALDAVDAERERRLRAPGALLAAALWYASQGVAVFALEPCGKRPLPRTHGFKDATTDPERIRAWWTAVPTANIGAPTGDTFDVIDIDGSLGARTIAGLRDQLPAIIGKASTARAAGTGRRYTWIKPLAVTAEVPTA